MQLFLNLRDLLRFCRIVFAKNERKNSIRIFKLSNQFIRKIYVEYSIDPLFRMQRIILIGGSWTLLKLKYCPTAPEEWSALDADAQALWSVQYYDMEEQEVDADYPGAVAHDTVTNTIENELDEHGQIQWEDHPTDTEKAYKLRFLDATGAQTDEANCVYRAAFVGCTYHCG